jgi:hypothetical protein
MPVGKVRPTLSLQRRFVVVHMHVVHKKQTVTYVCTDVYRPLQCMDLKNVSTILAAQAIICEIICGKTTCGGGGVRQSSAFFVRENILVGKWVGYTSTISTVSPKNTYE